MTEAWMPQEAGVQQLCHLLSDFQKPGTNQGLVLQQLEQYRSYPDFNNYLSFIFAKGEQLPIEVRQGAGLLLKNNLKHQYVATAEEHRTYIKAVLLLVLPHASKPLRQTAGTIVSTIVAVVGLGTWPDLVAVITQCLQAQDVAAADGGLDALYKIIEDTPISMTASVAAINRPVSCVVVPPLLALMQSAHADLRRQAVSCLNLMARDMPTGLTDDVDKYLQGLFALAHDTSAEVRRVVCTGLVQMLTLQPEKLQPFLHNIVEYMLASNEHADEGVALESCEFWNAFCEAQLEPALLKPFLPRLIPVLMKNMVFDEYDEEVQDAEAAEAAGVTGQDDRDQDIQHFHSSRQQRSDPSGNEGGTAGVAGEGDEDDEDNSPSSRWNLRKCSAEGLDRLSLVYGDELLPVLLPIVEQRLQDEDWRARESAILALGAISEGCHQGLIPHLASMVAMLLPKLADPRPMVRIISCWALSRYSHWLLTGVSDRNSQAAAQLDSVLLGVLGRVLDPNRFVQEAACSALATLEETAGQERNTVCLIVHLRALVDTLAAAAARYGRRNVRILCDAVSMLFEAVGPQELSDPALVHTLMPPLCQRLLSLDAYDRTALPLLDCLTNVCVPLGHCRALDSYAQPLWDKALSILQLQLAARGNAAAAEAAAAAGQAAPSPPAPEYERELATGAMDLLAGLAEGLGASVEPLVASGPLMEVILQCCQDDDANVRQSAFALVGDLSRVCIGRLQPALAALVAAALQNLETRMLTEDNMRACNNACWALGELSIKITPDQLLPYATAVAERAAGILMLAPNMQRSILENSAITLGRVAMACPEPIAPHLALFCGQWCVALRNIRDDIEKEHAFLGLCRMIRLNADAAVGCAAAVCNAFASWREVACEGLRNEMAVIMRGLHPGLVASGQWQMLEGAVQHKLMVMYAL